MGWLSSEYWQVGNLVTGHRERRTTTLNSSQASAFFTGGASGSFRISFAYSFCVSWWLLGLAEIEMPELSRSRAMSPAAEMCRSVARKLRRSRLPRLSPHCESLDKGAVCESGASRSSRHFSCVLVRTLHWASTGEARQAFLCDPRRDSSDSSAAVFEAVSRFTLCVSTSCRSLILALFDVVM